MRDSQKTKVYTAENAIDSGRRFADIDEAREYLHELLGDQAVIERFMISPDWPFPSVKLARANSHHSFSNKWRNAIELHTRDLNVEVLVHEFAHLLTPIKAGAHGWEFCDALLWLVDYTISTEAAEHLRSLFDESGVKYRRPVTRNLSPEAKAAASKRLAAARAAREAKRCPTIIENLDGDRVVGVYNGRAYWTTRRSAARVFQYPDTAEKWIERNGMRAFAVTKPLTPDGGDPLPDAG